MSLPTPYTLQVREPHPGELDEFGNATVMWTERSWPVHGVSPGAMVEPGQPNRDLSIISHTIYGPKLHAPTVAEAEVFLDGEWHAVNGTPKDWTRGPFPGLRSIAGVVVELRRTDG